MRNVLVLVTDGFADWEARISGSLNTYSFDNLIHLKEEAH